MNKEEFEKVNVFGLGNPNDAFAQYFIGQSYLNPLTDLNETSLFLANVTFEPGCRNNWHIHHASTGGGQLLICTAGYGWYQEEGKEAISLEPGKVITIPANVKHWHGAKKDSWFSHIAIEVPGENTSNEWLEKLTEEEYNTFRVNIQQAVYKKDVPWSYSPYLESRGISAEVQKKFRVYESPTEHKVYLPVFSRSGQYLYANARSTQGKHFFIEEGRIKTLAYIEEVNFSKPIAICESQINALTLYTAEFARAVATLGVANVHSLSMIRNATGPFLLMFDGDDYGHKAAKKALDYLGAYRCIVFDFKSGEDVNSLWQACGFNTDVFFNELELRRRK